jgi:hypothetical protein
LAEIHPALEGVARDLRASGGIPVLIEPQIRERNFPGAQHLSSDMNHQRDGDVTLPRCMEGWMGHIVVDLPYRSIKSEKVRYEVYAKTVLTQAVAE